MKNIILYIAIISIFLSSNFSYSKEFYYDGKLRQFHPPATEAERRLDYIINFGPRSILSKEEEWPHLTHKLEPEIAAVFTKEFIYDFSKKEKKLLDDECDGKYLEGELCGFGFDLLTCSISGPDIISYSTFEQNDDYAIIGYSWPDEDNKPTYPLGIYKLVKHNNTWLLDGISCWKFIKLNFGN